MDTNELFVPQKHPLLVYTVLQNVLEHLSVPDIKNFRLVCQQWKFASDPFLRKKAKIGFSYLLYPDDFIRQYSNTLRALPFRDFKFYTDEPLFEKLYGFVQEWNNRETIRSLQFASPNLLAGYTKKDYKFIYGISNIIKAVAQNLVRIEICGYQYILSLGVLSSIPNVVLKNCDVTVDYMIYRIYPVTIVMQGVNFLEQGRRMYVVVLNEFINFSRCSYINLDDTFINNKIFELSADKINADKIIFKDISLTCNQNTNIKAAYLKVSTLNVNERLGINVIKLELKQCFVVYSQIPESVEHLMLMETKGVAFASEPCALKNLKYLTVVFPHSQSFFRFTALEKFQTLRHFRNSMQIIGMEYEILDYEEAVRELSLLWLPKGLQKLKFVRPMKLKLIPGVELLNINVLILQHCTVSCVAKMINRINPKMLIVSMVNDLSDIMDDLILFLLTEQRINNIVVGCSNGFENDELFEQAPISKFVDRNSKYFEFQNGIGKAISERVFEKYVALY